MTEQKIDAPRITKPIQLLAAWLIGLVLVDGSFLGTAISLGASWERSALIIAAILNVPGFLFAIFLLQTKFMPELQEDVFYSRYISKKTSSQFEINKIDLLGNRISELQDKIENELSLLVPDPVNVANPQLNWSDWKIGINVQLPFFSDLRRAFVESRIPIEVAFGEGTSALSSYDVSISEDMGSQHVLALLKVIAKFPIDRFNFWRPVREIEENEDVYIGSYGGDENPIRLTESVSTANFEDEDALDLMKLRNQISN